VTRDDPADICQPNARAFKLFGTMQTVECLKQSLRMAHIKPTPLSRTKMTSSSLPSSLKPISIRAGSRGRVYLTALDSKFTNTWLSNAGSPCALGNGSRFHTMLRPFTSECRLRIDSAGPEPPNPPPWFAFLPTDPGEGQQVIDELAHLFHRIRDPAQSKLPLLVQFLTGQLAQYGA